MHKSKYTQTLVLNAYMLLPYYVSGGYDDMNLPQNKLSI